MWLHELYTKSIAKQSRNKSEGEKYKESGAMWTGGARGKAWEGSPRHRRAHCSEYEIVMLSQGEG